MTIIRYNPKLKVLAARLRNQSTKSEILLWQELKNKKINGYRFIRQKPLGDYIVDFYCKEAGLVIEVDGISHQWDEVLDKDEIKQHYLKQMNLQVLRFQDDEVVNDIRNVLRVIERALALR